MSQAAEHSPDSRYSAGSVISARQPAQSSAQPQHYAAPLPLVDTSSHSGQSNPPQRHGLASRIFRKSTGAVKSVGTTVGSSVGSGVRSVGTTVGSGVKSVGARVGSGVKTVGTSIRPSRQSGSEQTGSASWYGGSFHGGKTANGERYDMNSMTAAHRTLPFGTVVKVKNLHNGRECVVRINNRGPFTKGRILDMSRAAADELNFVSRGICKVQMQVLGMAEN